MTVRHPEITNLIAKLEQEYPDSILIFSRLDEEEKIKYLAKLELIEYIKLLSEPKKEKDK
jgi:hypothetical protein